jgi:endonuclease/exonuclease/phosphatase family metal-dependent hydrolase
MSLNAHQGLHASERRDKLLPLRDAMRIADADLVFLQEVRQFHQRDARQFARTWFGWPEQGQAEFLAPEGCYVAYRTNAVVRGGEHGNALLSRWPIGDIGHHDVSDHRFEQRGLLHVPVHWSGARVNAVVAHFGLIHSSRMRQVQRLAEFIGAHVPRGERLIVAGDFNDWADRLDVPMHAVGLHRARVPGDPPARSNTFPSRIPMFSMDRVYVRGLRCLSTWVPRATAWARMSDHLPLVVELALD